MRRQRFAYSRLPSADHATCPLTNGSWIRVSRSPESTSRTFRWLPDVYASTCAAPGRQAMGEKLAPTPWSPVPSPATTRSPPPAR